jgi:hypothetical protein
VCPDATNTGVMNESDSPIQWNIEKKEYNQADGQIWTLTVTAIWNSLYGSDDGVAVCREYTHKPTEMDAESQKEEIEKMIEAVGVE